MLAINETFAIEVVHDEFTVIIELDKVIDILSYELEIFVITVFVRDIERIPFVVFHPRDKFVKRNVDTLS
jgi:hypothetical protein